MAIGVYFHPKSMNTTQYNRIIQLLEEAGQGAPKGRQYHTCFGVGDQLMVFDIWESQADFDKFGETLVPILASILLDPGKPDIVPVVNIIK
jgi:hypothetical protein